MGKRRMAREMAMQMLFQAELGGTPPVDFAADVAQLETLIESVTVEKTRIAWQKRHPIFGRMSEAAWLRWAYLHLDHHLRQFGV